MRPRHSGRTPPPSAGLEPVRSPVPILNDPFSIVFEYEDASLLASEPPGRIEQAIQAWEYEQHDRPR